MATTIDEVFARVRRDLEIAEVPFQFNDDHFAIRSGAIALLLMPSLLNEEEAMLRVVSPIRSDVKKKGNGEMFEHFSTINAEYVFGRIYWVPDEDGATTGTITLEHNLLLDGLSQAALVLTLRGLAITAERLDEEIGTSYGGTRFID